MRGPCNPPEWNSGMAFSPSTRLGSTRGARVISRRSTGAITGVDLVGHHHRRAEQRQLQRHGAGGGERRARQLEGAELVLLAVAAGAAAPARPAAACSTSRRTEATDGHGHLELAAALDAAGPACSPNGCIRRSDLRACGCPAAPAAAACRPAAAGVAARGAGSSACDPRPPLDQRMADVGAGRPAEALVRVRLERQQRQHVIDILAHLARTTRPPRPHAGRHVVDDAGCRGRRWRMRSRDRVRELGAVDDHHRVGLGCDRGRRRAVDAAQDPGQPRRGWRRCPITATSLDRETARPAPAAAICSPPTPR